MIVSFQTTSFPRASIHSLIVAHQKTHEYECNSNKKSYSQKSDTRSEMGQHYTQTKEVYRA